MRFLAMRIKFYLFLALLLPALLGHGSKAWSQQEIGDAVRVVNVVTGSGGAGERRLAAEDPIYRSENISAALDSRGELLLHDGSRVIVGENASISMDDFVVAGDSFGQGTIRVARGAFRFISGASGSNVTFQTPLANIGVRGTVFDLYVEPSGVTRVVLLSGSVQACTRQTGNCVVADRACDIVEISGPDTIEELPFLRSRQRSRAQDAATFTLMEQQHRHSAGWRAPEIGCMARAAEETHNNRARANDGPSAPGQAFSPPSPPDSDDGDGDGDGEGEGGEGGDGGYGGQEG
jgi:ferric-dicitrate binding protein FerR (iron transport regulator)